MPRLIGKQSNRNWYAGLFVIIMITVAISLEYAGFTNVFQGFGRDHRFNNQSQPEPRHE